MTYLNRKTHLQVVFSVMRPPRSGPRLELSTMVSEMAAMTVPQCLVGTSSGLMMLTRALIPEAPKPWKARRMMLEMLARKGDAVASAVQHSQLIHGGGEAASDGCDGEDGRRGEHGDLPTQDIAELGVYDEEARVREEVGSDDPIPPVEVVQGVGDGNQGRADDRRLEGRQEEGEEEAW